MRLVEGLNWTLSKEKKVHLWAVQFDGGKLQCICSLVSLRTGPHKCRLAGFRVSDSSF